MIWTILYFNTQLNGLDNFEPVNKITAYHLPYQDWFCDGVTFGGKKNFIPKGDLLLGERPNINA